jgi:hypothetical protein
VARLRAGRQAAALEIEQNFAPGLRALPVTIGDRQQLLAAQLVGTDDHQDALPVLIQPRREVDAIGPEVDVTLGR